MKTKKQKDIFLDTEGDNWFLRNRQALEANDAKTDPLLNEILKISPPHKNNKVKIIEVGCGNGKRLKELQTLGYEVSGIDPSKIAVEDALKKGVLARIGTADELPFIDNSFDILVFGFCLYLCDREDLFKIAAEANRVLKSPGNLFILDFYSKNEIANDYHDLDEIKSYKMDYRKLFDWHPNYSLVKQVVGSHHGFQSTDDKNEWISISVLRKF